MKKFTLLSVLLGGAALAVAGILYFRGDTGARDTKQAMALRAAPRFELKDSQGKTRRLEEFRGKIVVLHFWASWCPPCISEISQWVELSGRFKGKSVAWVAVSLDARWEDALKVLPSQNLPPQVVSLLDSSGKVPEEYGTFQFPETYILNPKLEIITKWVGPQDWTGAAMTSLIDNALINNSDTK